MASPSPRNALRNLITWFTGGDKTGNPYLHAPVSNAILALTRGKSKFDSPASRPSAKIDRALYDLVELATSGERHGNPYMKPAVKAAIVALGGDGYELPASRKRTAHAAISTAGGWAREHKSSGATVIERRAFGSVLKVTPKDWTDPTGPANWSVTRTREGAGAFDHTRGEASTVKGAKAAAVQTAKSMERKGVSHARKKKLTHAEAKSLLQLEGINFNDDYHAAVSMSQGNRIAEVAKMAGYRKSKNAPGSTARMYFQRLSRLGGHATRRSDGGKITVYDLVSIDGRTKKETVLHRHFSTRSDAKEAANEYKTLKRPGVTYSVRPRKTTTFKARWNRED